MQSQPALFILMRNDMDSLNPGKAMAQASHATNDFMRRMESVLPTQRAIFENWEKEAGTFGTCLVFAGSEQQIRTAHASLQAREVGESRIYSGLTVDPTYPVRDGEITHLVEIMTCGWLFGDRSTISCALRDIGMSLHP